MLTEHLLTLTVRTRSALSAAISPGNSFILAPLYAAVSPGSILVLAPAISKLQQHVNITLPENLQTPCTCVTNRREKMPEGKHEPRLRRVVGTGQMRVLLSSGLLEMERAGAEVQDERELLW